MSIQAWQEFGAAGEEPIHVARELSKLLDQRQAASGWARGRPDAVATKAQRALQLH
jgi:hypothetical protein